MRGGIVGAFQVVGVNQVAGVIEQVAILGFQFRDSCQLPGQSCSPAGFVAAHGNHALLERTIRKYFEKLLNLNITDFSRIGADIAPPKHTSAGAPATFWSGV